MAASAPNPYEEHITCSVCLEIYTNPQALKCLHTYCYQCILDLNDGFRVQCPDCREYTNINQVKKDFKIQSFIDIHKTTTQQTLKSHTEISCDVCEESGKPVQSFCTNCEEHVCADCARAHRGMKLTKSHKLIAFKDLCKSKQDQVDEQINILMNEHTDVDRKLTSNRELINNIHQAEARHIAEVNRYRTTIKQHVDDHHDAIIDEIRAINRNILETLEQQGQLITQAKQQLNDKVKFLSDISQSQDYLVLTDTLKNLSEQIQQVLQQICTGLPKFDAHTKSPVTVVKGEAWDPLKSTRLEVAGTARTTKRRAIPQPKMQHRNKDIYPRYGQVKCVDIEYYPTKLCVGTDQLWVGGASNGLLVYDLDLQLIQHITHRQFHYVTSVLNTAADIIVCDSDTGLHHLNQQGDYLQCVSVGCFSDVDLYNNKLYAFNYEQHSINIFSQNQNNWVKYRDISLSHYNGGTHKDKLCVTSTGIYLSCRDTHSVQCYSLTGQFVYQAGKYGCGRTLGEFYGPYISDADSRGRGVLVCDFINHRLQVLLADTREWREVTLLEEVRYPVCAGVRDKHLWVGTVWNKLLKYKVMGE